MFFFGVPLNQNLYMEMATAAAKLQFTIVMQKSKFVAHKESC